MEKKLDELPKIAMEGTEITAYTRLLHKKLLSTAFRFQKSPKIEM